MRLGMSARRKRFGALPVLVAAVLAAIVIFTGVRFHNAFLSAAHAYANNIATSAVSNSVYKVFSGLEDSEYAKITNSDRATMFTTDTARLNLLNSQLAELIQSDVLKGDYTTVCIPLGSVSGIAAFSGTGIKIPLKIHPISLVNTDFDEAFESCGINQVRHTVSLKVEIVMAYSGYLFSDSENVTVTVPISDSVIVGDTPEYYGGGEFFAGNEVRR